MKNNKGYGKFEVLTVIVLLMGIGSFLAYIILGNSDSQDFGAMRKDASSFSKTVVNNLNSFEKIKNVYYLGEIIDDGLMQTIKNPFGSGDCDVYESKIDVDGQMKYLTFKCGDYVINKVNTRDNKYDIYKVGVWTEEAVEGESQMLNGFNCDENGKMVFDNYMEEGAFLIALSKLYGANIDTVEMANNYCKVSNKTLYRSLELVNEG